MTQYYYQHKHLEEFTASAIDDPALIDLNIRSIDLSWVTQFNCGEIENDSIPFILDKLNWNISRLITPHSIECEKWVAVGTFFPSMV
jgi:hypothetical protein